MTRKSPVKNLHARSTRNLQI